MALSRNLAAAAGGAFLSAASGMLALWLVITLYGLIFAAADAAAFFVFTFLLLLACTFAIGSACDAILVRRGLAQAGFYIVPAAVVGLTFGFAFAAFMAQWAADDGGPRGTIATSMIIVIYAGAMSGYAALGAWFIGRPDRRPANPDKRAP